MTTGPESSDRLADLLAHGEEVQVPPPRTIPSVRLTRLYARLNRELFDGRLPTRRVAIVEGLMQATGHVGRAEWLDDTVGVQAGLPPERQREILLHEMCHVAVDETGHGEAWRREMEQLLAQGEEWVKHDPEYDPEFHEEAWRGRGRNPRGARRSGLEHWRAGGGTKPTGRTRTCCGG